MKKMSKNPIMIACVFMLIVMLLSACSKESTTERDSNKIQIVTTIAQIAEPIAIIGGDHVQVTSLMGPGVDPHLYQATTGDITKLDKSDIILYSGLHLEANMVKVFDELGKSKPVAAISEQIAQEYLLKDENGAVDPHIWFDIDLWKQSLSVATEQLIAYAPEFEDDFLTNQQQYFAQLDQLKEDSLKKLQEIPVEQRVLVTAHDAFGYFGNMTGINVIGLQGLSTEAEIGLTDIEETIAILEQYKVPAVFIESSINPDSIQAVIEGANKSGVQVQLGGELFSDAMGEEGTAEGTYIGMYLHNVETIYKALVKKG